MRKIFQSLGLLREVRNGWRRSRRKSAVTDTSCIARPEQLEQRRLLAVDVVASPVVSGKDNWVSVVGDNDDIYVQHVANSERDLYIANNGGLVNATEIPNFLSTYNSLNIFEGQVLQETNLRRDNTPFDTTFSSETLAFELPYGDIDTDNFITGVLRIDGNVISFTNQGTGLVFTSSLFSQPIIGSFQGGVANVVPAGGITSRAVVSRLSLTQPQFSEIISIDSDISLDIGFDADLDTLRLFGETEQHSNAVINRSVLGLKPISSLPGDQEFGFSTVDFTAGLYVPGTLNGSITVEALGVTLPYTFQVDSLADASSTSIPVSFNSVRDLTPLASVSAFYEGITNNEFTTDMNSGNTTGGGTNSITTTVAGIRVDGSFNPQTGVLSVGTFYERRTTSLVGDNVSTSSSFAPIGANIVVNNLEAGWYQRSDHTPITAAVFPGLTHTVGLNVELPTAGSTVLVDSPVQTAGTTFGEGDLRLAASEIKINTPVFASQTFTVPDESSSSLGTRSEVLVINATASSPAFTIHLVDDDRTSTVTRSQLVVSQSGSLSASAGGLNNAPSVFTPAASSFIEVVDGDVFVEGSVVANLQSYVMSSGIGSQDEAPYFLTTKSRLTGIDVGSVVGDTLSLTLANDTLGEDFLSLATSEVFLSTDVNRLRTQAATRVGDEMREMFPYVLTILEENDLIIDAVAGSSEKMTIKAGGSLDLLGAIRSQHDVVLESVADFQVSAPISTAFGSVSLRGPNVTVDSPILVLDAIRDERIVDVRIDATSPTGSLVLNDAISGLNRVELNTLGSVTGNARVRGDTVDVDVQGDVSLFTNANLITVDSPGTVRVEDSGAAAFEIRQSSDVTIVAHGHDRLVDHDSDPNTDDVLSPALFADVYGTTDIVVSAPNGSIDVLHRGSQVITVGDIDNIRADVELTPGTSAMLAGGSAIFRSTLSPFIAVQDFPSAVSGGEIVRLATTEPLPLNANYIPGLGAPGTYATKLQVQLPYSIETGRFQQLDNVDVSKVRVGDRILVKDGKLTSGDNIDHRINGIYVILRIDFAPATEDNPATPNLDETAPPSANIVLARATTHDESSELRERTYVKVSGVADPESRLDSSINTLSGKSFASQPFEVVSPFANNTAFGSPATGMEISAVPSASGYLVASAMTSSPIVSEAEFSNGQIPDNGNYIDTITAMEFGPIGDDSSLFGGVSLNQADLVLVNAPVTAGEGVTAVSDELTKEALGLYIVDKAGSLDSKWVLKRYDGYDENGDGVRDLEVESLVTIAGGRQRTAITGMMYKLNYQGLHTSNLRYQPLSNYVDEITFGSSSEETVIPVFNTNAHVRTDIGMDNPNGVVQYEITTEGATNSSAGSLGRMLGVLQDNSAFVPRTREPQRYETIFSQDVSNIVLEQQLPSIRKKVGLSPAIPVSIDGSEITITREGAVVPTGTITSGIGPIRPSQVNTSRRLVRSENVGLAYLNGLEFIPGSDGSHVSNITIGGFNTGSAIFVGGARNVLIDDVILGEDSSGGPLPNRYGVYVTQVAGGAGTDFTTITDSRITSSVDTGIYLGLNANNVRVVGNSEIGRITADLEDRRGNVVGLKNDSVAGRNLIGAAPVLNAIEGVVAIARQNTLILPDTFNRDDLYLGQGVADYSGSNDIVAADTEITAIRELPDNRTEITISSELQDTAVISLIPVITDARNKIQFNSDGVVLESGSTRMVMTDVTHSVFDGILIGQNPDSQDAGQHVIGGVDYAGVIGQNIPNRSNVAVHSNGLSGISFTDRFFAGLTEEEKIEKVNRVKIRGNFLGTDIDNNTGLTNGRDGSQNIVIAPSVNIDGNPTVIDDNAGIRAILLEDASPLDGDPRDTGLYYTARYRAEDNPLDDPLLEDRENFDAEGNGQVIGAPLTGTFPGGGGSGTTDPDDPRGPSAPPTMR